MKLNIFIKESLKRAEDSFDSDESKFSLPAALLIISFIIIINSYI